MFIISTQFKAVEVRDAVKAAELLRNLVERLPAHRGATVTLWASDWRAYREVLYFSGLDADSVDNVVPLWGSRERGFQSVWKA